MFRSRFIKSTVTSFAIAAISLTGLTLPASATTTSIAIPQSAAGEINHTNTGLTKLLAVELEVPNQDLVQAKHSLGITISGLSPTTEVVVKATNAKLVTSLHSYAATVRSNSGSESLTLYGSNGSSTSFFVYTTSTEYGAVTISYLGNTNTYHLKGIAGPAYNIALITPTYMNLSSSYFIEAVVSDVFGNKLTPTSNFDPEQSIKTALVGDGELGDFGWHLPTGKLKAPLVAGERLGNLAISAQIAATLVPTLNSPSNLAVNQVTVKDLNLEIDSLLAQLGKANQAANRAKKKFNKLANKWNKNFPNRKIAKLK